MTVVPMVVGFVVGAAVLTACGSASRSNGSATSSSRLPLCNPAAADYQKQGMPTPAPCISFDPQAQMRENVRGLIQRSKPKPEDVAALESASLDLERMFADLRAKSLYDPASVNAAIAGLPSLQGASVHAVSPNEILPTPGPTPMTMVALERRSACLLGEHGPERSLVMVVGHTLDGSCESFYAH